MKILLLNRKNLRQDVCEKYWNKFVLDVIWKKVVRAHSSFREARELRAIEIEDNLRKKYDYYKNLQGALQGMDAMMFGARFLIKNLCTMIPSYKSEAIPTYALSCSSIRRQQLKLPHSKRLNLYEFTLLTQNLPKYDKLEGVYFDKDVQKIVYRFFKTARFEAWKEKKIQKEKDDAVLAIQRKKEEQIERLRKQGRKIPPPPPPMSPVELTLHLRRLKREAVQKAAEEAEKARDEDKTFDPFKLKNKEWLKPRRHSITDASSMYSRIISMKEHLILNAFCRRRNSLPVNIKNLHVTAFPSFSYIPSIQTSLDMFHMRNNELSWLFNPAQQDKWKGINKNNRKKIIRKIMSGALLNPRLPLEMSLMIKEGQRRRTIAEPERLERQLNVMFKIRDNLALCRKECRYDLNLPIRRRSFDFGEILDEEEGITQTLGLEFDEPWKLTSVTEFSKAKLKIESILNMKGLNILKEEFQEKNDADFQEFAPIYEAEKQKDMAKLAGIDEPIAKPTPKIPAKVWGAKLIPVIWQEHFSEEGFTYYYREDTGESAWDLPSGSNVQILSQYQDSSGAWYWFNNVTAEVTWI